MSNFEEKQTDQKEQLMGDDKVDYRESPGGMLQVLGAFTKAVATGEPAAGGTAGTANLP